MFIRTLKGKRTNTFINLFRWQNCLNMILNNVIAFVVQWSISILKPVLRRRLIVYNDYNYLWRFYTVSQNAELSVMCPFFSAILLDEGKSIPLIFFSFYLDKHQTGNFRHFISAILKFPMENLNWRKLQERETSNVVKCF